MIIESVEQNISDRPSKKKPHYPVQDSLRNYLKNFGREVRLPALYEDLQRFTFTTPIKHKDGTDSSWERTSYDMREWQYLKESLVENYLILKTRGDFEYAKHLDVAAVDFCFFGNSQPFRIRIINKYNDNYDHYYIKKADSSRIFGLELEHLLSPNRITYFTNYNTLIEEHIPGIPGDVFINDYLDKSETNQIRLAKEFVKFNTRCFAQLLGDMRSYNYVVNITPDVLNYQYRFRAIDFDQQSYEGRKNLYLPQFFKENNAFVQIVLKHLNKESILQYQAEEKTAMAFRLASSRYRIKELFDIMTHEELTKPEKLEQLKIELAEHHNNPIFLKVKTVGQLVKLQLKVELKDRLSHIPIPRIAKKI